MFSVAYDIHIKWYFLTHLSSASLIYISSHASLLLYFLSLCFFFFYKSSVDCFVSFQPSNSICKVIDKDSFSVSWTQKLKNFSLIYISSAPLLLSQILKHIKVETNHVLEGFNLFSLLFFFFFNMQTRYLMRIIQA